MLRAPISLAGSTRRGMVTAQVALSLSALMAMLAVVADGGLLLVERRHAQATADAAALAAASDLYVHWNTNWLGPSGTASASAMGVASANGYTNDGTTSTVTVNIPPREVFRRTQCRHDFASGLRRGDRDVVPATLF